MNFLLGILILFICTVIQCAMIAALRIAVRDIHKSSYFRHSFLHETALLSAVVLALFCGMLLQVAIWASVFLATGEIQDPSRALYFSLVNFTTLGYGDVLLSKNRAILGAMEASNGILMLGLSTSFLFNVLGVLIHEKR